MKKISFTERLINVCCSICTASLQTPLFIFFCCAFYFFKFQAPKSILWIFICIERQRGKGKKGKKGKNDNFTTGFFHIRNIKRFCNSVMVHYWERSVHYFHFFYFFWITSKRDNLYKFVHWIKLLNNCYIRINSRQKVDHELVQTLLHIINMCHFE